MKFGEMALDRHFASRYIRPNTGVSMEWTQYPAAVPGFMARALSCLFAVTLAIELSACGDGSNASDASMSSDAGRDAALTDSQVVPDQQDDAINSTDNGGGLVVELEGLDFHSIPIPGRRLNIEANVTGGEPPYSYAWEPADRFTQDNFEVFRTEQEVGDYTTCVTVTDALGAVASDCLTHTVYAAPVATLSAVPAQICVQDGPLELMFSDNVPEVFEPTIRSFRIGRVNPTTNMDRILIRDPGTAYTWELTTALVGDWEVSYFVQESGGAQSRVVYPITVLDCL